MSDDAQLVALVVAILGFLTAVGKGVWATWMVFYTREKERADKLQAVADELLKRYQEREEEERRWRAEHPESAPRRRSS